MMKNNLSRSFLAGLSVLVRRLGSRGDPSLCRVQRCQWYGKRHGPGKGCEFSREFESVLKYLALRDKVLILQESKKQTLVVLRVH